MHSEGAKRGNLFRFGNTKKGDSLSHFKIRPRCYCYLVIYLQSCEQEMAEVRVSPPPLVGVASPQCLVSYREVRPRTWEKERALKPLKEVRANFSALKRVKGMRDRERTGVLPISSVTGAGSCCTCQTCVYAFRDRLHFDCK